ncbi:hypothetical protein KEM55_004120, partial [Ascosphaera atra]
PSPSRVVRLGRSSISCDFQLPPSNRGISRVHVAAAYRPATAIDHLDDEDEEEAGNGEENSKEHVEIRCLGWNGITLYCQEQSYDLRKGSVFTSDIKHADILLDVQGSRVLIRWPSKHHHPHDHDHDTRDEEATLSGKRDVHASSPPPIPRASRLVEQISRLTPTPGPGAGSPVSSPQRRDGGGQRDEGRANALMIPSSPVMVYEDDDRSPSVGAKHEEEGEVDEEEEGDEENDPERSFRSSSRRAGESVKGRNGVRVDPLSGSGSRERRENGREREPATTRQNHGNGTGNGSGSGQNNAGRAASRTRNRDRHASRSKAEHPPSDDDEKDDANPSEPPAYFDDHIPSLDASPATTDAIRNHAVNQLAFSRLNSTPLSTILNHLPPEYWRRSPTSTRGLTRSEIAGIIEGTRCIGVVSREGKDAAGKPLESEYYYVPDEDGDEGRRVAVTSQLMKSGLRSCRKQHKVWKAC